VYVLQGSLRRFPAGGGAPVLLAGADEPGYADGRGAAARFNFPTGLCVAADGTVYVADRGNHLIRQVSPAGDVTTLAGQPGAHPLRSGAGQGQYKYAPDDSGNMDFTALGDYHDGPAASARFNHPAAVALGPGGVLYVADEDNDCLRVIRPAPASG
jgi:DNA-binding beta-propeller fold protein YncE